jgi:hypothetical protein
MSSMQTLNLILLLAQGPLVTTPSVPDYILMEDNSSFILQEDNSSLIQMEQP